MKLLVKDYRSSDLRLNTSKSTSKQGDILQNKIVQKLNHTQTPNYQSSQKSIYNNPNLKCALSQDIFSPAYNKAYNQLSNTFNKKGSTKSIQTYVRTSSCVGKSRANMFHSTVTFDTRKSMLSNKFPKVKKLDADMD